MCGGGNKELGFMGIESSEQERELCRDSNNKSHLFKSPVAVIYTGSADTVQRSQVSFSYKNDQFASL